jgi:hypothetical protein
VTVQVLTALCPRLVGLHAMPDTRTGTDGATRLMAAVWELVPRVAVTVALWLLAIRAAALALNVTLVAPAGTVTEAGPLSAMAVVAVSTLALLYVKFAVTEPFVCVPYSDVPVNPVWFPSVHAGVLPVPAV